ncbi:hypothetical protein [Ancylobacter oerskovii]|uniref:DUF308 domain-containing protein n=1 Tax=Ancylobacter oerskovii TaxID=459519 RepID=A0ABW4YX78_9HYPH|nr:hypothetical protein [Ancylobacter oerskovii]MBS7542043.1 hypothetical protein [Ancylobacter oerskovii]
MGAIIIGIGLVVGAIGVVIGLIGVQSLAQPSGPTLVIVGTLGFVGGLLLLALGSIHRALVDIGQKLDGVVHVEAEDYYESEGARPIAFHEEAERAVTPVEPVREPARHAESVAETALPPVAAPAPVAPLPAAPLPAGPATPVPQAAIKGLAGSLSGSLPAWFRRKRAEPADEPELEPETAFDETPALGEPAGEALELPPFELSDLLEPEPAPRHEPAPKPEAKPQPETKPQPESKAPAAPKPAPAAPKPPIASPAASPIVPPAAKPTEPKPIEAKPAEPKPAPLAPKPGAGEAARPVSPVAQEALPADADDGPGAPPAFLHVNDLVDEPAPASITVLKAGVIGGMAYKLFSDGSIEAELPDGTLRFASLQELRDHVSGVGQG